MNTLHVILLIIALVSFLVAAVLSAINHPSSRLALSAVAVGLALWVFITLLVAVGAG